MTIYMDALPKSAVSDEFPMVSDVSKVPNMRVSHAADLAVYEAATAYVDGKLPKVYVNGTLKTAQRLEWIDSVTTTSGSATFYLTSDRTSTGTARAAAIDLDSVMLRTVDETGQYAFGAVISPNVKTVVAVIFKQVFSGLVLLSTNLLGSVTNSAAPNGTVVKGVIKGDAA